MSEFQNDLHIDQPDDSDLIRQLRKQLREKDKTIGEQAKQLETYETTSRASSLGDILKSKGIAAKVAGLIPKDVDPTPEGVQAWLDEFGDAFAVQQDPGADPAGAGGDGSVPDPAVGENAAAAGLSADEVAALTAARRTEQAGQQVPLLGQDKARQTMADARALPQEQAFQKLREAGLLAG